MIRHWMLFQDTRSWLVIMKYNMRCIIHTVAQQGDRPGPVSGHNQWMISIPGRVIFDVGRLRLLKPSNCKLRLTAVIECPALVKLHWFNSGIIPWSLKPWQYCRLIQWSTALTWGSQATRAKRAHRQAINPLLNHGSPWPSPNDTLSLPFRRLGSNLNNCHNSINPVPTNPYTKTTTLNHPVSSLPLSRLGSKLPKPRKRS